MNLYFSTCYRNAFLFINPGKNLHDMAFTLAGKVIHTASFYAKNQ